ncbi:MAG: hypothetical protein ACTSX4_09105 [Candidatus Helarchaeota archaeon]
MFYQYQEWHPPINPEITQPVSINTLLDKPEYYKPPMLLVINGDVKNKTGDIIFLTGLFDAVIKINCSSLNIDDIQAGMTLYIKGYSHYHEADKYFTATEIHVQVSYSLYLSIPGAVIILIILFVVFKFKLKDFSFSRKTSEVKNDA